MKTQIELTFFFENQIELTKHDKNGVSGLKLLPDEELLGVGKFLGTDGFTSPNTTWIGVSAGNGYMEEYFVNVSCKRKIKMLGVVGGPRRR